MSADTPTPAGLLGEHIDVELGGRTVVRDVTLEVARSWAAPTAALLARARPICAPGTSGTSLSISASIAAASVVAKVTRDRIMVALAQQFPGYAWEKNMGYGTQAHRDGLDRLGVTQHHRKSFAPIRKML